MSEVIEASATDVRSIVSEMSAAFGVLEASLRKWDHLGNVDAQIGPNMLVKWRCGLESRKPAVQK